MLANEMDTSQRALIALTLAITYLLYLRGFTRLRSGGGGGDRPAAIHHRDRAATSSPLVAFVALYLFSDKVAIRPDIVLGAGAGSLLP